MPRYRVTLSDGRMATVEADAPPSAEDVLAAIGQHASASREAVLPPALRGGGRSTEPTGDHVSATPETHADPWQNEPTPSVGGALGNAASAFASGIGGVLSSIPALAKEGASEALHMVNPGRPRDESGPISTLVKLGIGGVEKLIPGDQGEAEHVANAFGRDYADKYGGLRNIAHTAYTDPFRVLSDVSMLLGAATLPAKAAGFAKTANALGTVSRVTNPVAMVARPIQAGARALAPGIYKRGIDLTPEQRKNFDVDQLARTGIQRGVVADTPESVAPALASAEDEVVDLAQRYEAARPVTRGALPPGPPLGQRTVQTEIPLGETPVPSGGSGPTAVKPTVVQLIPDEHLFRMQGTRSPSAVQPQYGGMPAKGAPVPTPDVVEGPGVLLREETVATGLPPRATITDPTSARMADPRALVSDAADFTARRQGLASTLGNRAELTGELGGLVENALRDEPNPVGLRKLLDIKRTAQRQGRWQVGAKGRNIGPVEKDFQTGLAKAARSTAIQMEPGLEDALRTEQSLIGLNESALNAKAHGFNPFKHHPMVMAAGSLPGLMTGNLPAAAGGFAAAAGYEGLTRPEVMHRLGIAADRFGRLQMDPALRAALLAALAQRSTPSR